MEHRPQQRSTVSGMKCIIKILCMSCSQHSTTTSCTVALECTSNNNRLATYVREYAHIFQIFRGLRTRLVLNLITEVSCPLEGMGHILRTIELHGQTFNYLIKASVIKLNRVKHGNGFLLS